MSQESHDLGPTPSLLTLAGYGDGYVGPGDEVYVVSEDTDYIYRNTGANPPADGFNIVKAVFLPGVWERRNNVPAGAGVGASALRFNTIAVGAVGSGRLIDVPLAGLIDGTSLAWTESVKDTWRWDATSTLTADNITVENPLANGVNPGRFIRELIPAPEWLQQATWFVDTAGSDENSGLTALAPVKTDAEIRRRWGASPAEISTTVTITYAQSQTATTNFDIDLIGDALVKFVGGFTVAQSGISISAVQIQARTAGAELGWAITGAGLGASDVGKLVEITAGTAGNIGAYARIQKDETGGKVRVSPFGKFNPTNFAAQFTAVTPLVGDTVRVVTPYTLRLGLLSVRSRSLAINGPTPAVIIDSLLVDGSEGGNLADQSTIEALGASVYIGRSIVRAVTVRGHDTEANYVRLVGGGADSVYVRDGRTEFNKCGLTNINGVGITVKAGGFATLTSDTYFQNIRLLVEIGGVATSAGAAFFDRVTASSTIIVSAGSRYTQTGAVPDWGTANAGYGITVASLGGYSYATKPTINSGLGAGRETRIGGTDKLYAAVPFIEPANNAALVLIA